MGKQCSAGFRYENYETEMPSKTKSAAVITCWLEGTLKVLLYSNINAETEVGDKRGVATSITTLLY